MIRCARTSVSVGSRAKGRGSELDQVPTPTAGKSLATPRGEGLPRPQTPKRLPLLLPSEPILEIRGNPAPPEPEAGGCWEGRPDVPVGKATWSGLLGSGRPTQRVSRMGACGRSGTAGAETGRRASLDWTRVPLAGRPGLRPTAEDHVGWRGSRLSPSSGSLAAQGRASPPSSAGTHAGTRRFLRRRADRARCKIHRQTGL